LPADFESFCSSIMLQGLALSTPWSSQACQQHCQQILAQLACTVAAAATQMEGGASSKQQQQQQQGVAGSLTQQQQQGCWQQLLGLLLPQLLDSLRDTLLAQHRHSRAHDKGELGGWHPGCFTHLVACCTMHLLRRRLPPVPYASSRVPGFYPFQ
jgi:hypothetical protein